MGRASSKVAEQAGTLIEKVVPAIEDTATQAHEIAEASREQNRSAGKILESVARLDLVIQSNTTTFKKTAKTVEQLLGNADDLESIMSFFKYNGSNGQRRPG